MVSEATWGNAGKGIPAKPIHHLLEQVTKILGKKLACSPGKRHLEHSKHQMSLTGGAKQIFHGVLQGPGTLSREATITEQATDT